MIPNNVKSKDLVGKSVRLTRDIANGAGFVIPKGTIVDVISMGRSFTIATRPCPCCGVHTQVRGVTRKQVELVGEIVDEMYKLYSEDYNERRQAYEKSMPQKNTVHTKIHQSCEFENHTIGGV